MEPGSPEGPFWSNPGAIGFITWISDEENYRNLNAVCPTHDSKYKNIFAQVVDYTNQMTGKDTVKLKWKYLKSNYQSSVSTNPLRFIQSMDMDSSALPTSSEDNETEGNVEEQEDDFNNDYDDDDVVEKPQRENAEDCKDQIKTIKEDCKDQIRLIREAAEKEKTELKDQIKAITATKEAAETKMWECQCEIAVLKEQVGQLNSRRL
ncbi:hypothetical protein BGW38_010783 [Lunasporangiospora selenospora]|uniref:Uncharacterized protein n=1 Tax=Lunasporangiospora selenospora TaxID=979761 RepID=A0A9P6KEP1_9FUNG|nr:hypothetical protein BGW38_010783 [Lunasporangiospora selenospora]